MAVKITFQDIVKTFGETRALDHVTLTIPAGDLFFLLGPSGCGKTTLLRSLAGFVIPDSGKILFDNEDISALPPHERDTGMVFQSYALWPHLTVAQNVAFGLEMRKVSKAEIRTRVAEALEVVKMSHRANHKPGQLSGGQQQRVALARALVIKPRCLLLDEPLSNLDAKLRADMRSEIRRICKEAGLTSLYVTHDQKEALSVADRIAVMRDGKIMQEGTPLEVYRTPTSMFTANFIGDVNFLPATVTQVADGAMTLDTEIGKFISTFPSSFKVGNSVQIGIRPEGLRFDTAPAGVNVVDGTLHASVYLGEVAQHQFRVGGTVLKAFELNPKRVAGEGAIAAKAWVAREDVMVLPNE